MSATLAQQWSNSVLRYRVWWREGRLGTLVVLNDCSCDNVSGGDNVQTINYVQQTITNWPSGDLVLGQRRRRRPNIKSTQGVCRMRRDAPPRAKPDAQGRAVWRRWWDAQRQNKTRAATTSDSQSAGGPARQRAGDDTSCSRAGRQLRLHRPLIRCECNNTQPD